MIRLLYEASQAGVRVDLLVRGICCLRPGLAGISQNIRVVSIVGRFLEHSRIFYFRNGSQDEIYLGSGDLMPRNLVHRVEVMFPLEEPSLVRHLRDEISAIWPIMSRPAPCAATEATSGWCRAVISLKSAAKHGFCNIGWLGRKCDDE